MQTGIGKMAASTSGAPRARPETIRRPRVLERLDRTGDARVALVCAPAGYGKTTALAEWHASLACPAVWLTLDQEDNDPRRLFSRLLDALDQLWPAALWPAQQAVLGGSDLSATAVPLAADALEAELAGTPLAIVLDDLHHVVERGCLELVTTLVAQLPDEVRFVFGSRSRPRLRLARGRVERLVADLGPADLVFTVEEAARLLDGALGLRLGTERTREITRRVEGWPAGLSLIASALRENRSADGLIPALPRSRELIAEYLLDEVLDGVSPQMQEFLARTSILERMCPALCESVCDDPHAGELLAEARRTNLFVVAFEEDGDGREWSRYHRLFADLLEQDLAARAPAEHADVHRRAARWFGAAGRAEEAIEHASRAGDGPLAAQLLYEHHGELVAARRYATIERLLQRMPPERGELGPVCELLGVLCTALAGADLRRVAGRLDALEAQRDAPFVAELLDTIRISPFYGDVPRAREIGWRRWRETAAQPARRSRFVGQFATVLWFAGEREVVQTTLAPYMGEVERPALRSWELATLALCAAEDGELETAERLAREAVATMVGNGAESAPEAQWAYVALADTLRRRGRLDESSQQIARALRATANAPGSMYQALALVLQAQIDLASRNRRAARRRTAVARAIIDAHADAGALTERLAAVEAALEQPVAVAIADSEPTDAELRVLALLPTALTRDQIAARLGLAPSTVKSHMWRIFRRLSARSRAEAVESARERGLL